MNFNNIKIFKTEKKNMTSIPLQFNVKQEKFVYYGQHIVYLLF